MNPIERINIIHDALMEALAKIDMRLKEHNNMDDSRIHKSRGLIWEAMVELDDLKREISTGEQYKDDEKKFLREAYTIVNPGAVNPTAMISTLYDWVLLMVKNGKDHEEIKNHPVVTLIMNQLMHVTRCDDSDMFSRAYALANKAYVEDDNEMP